jgi:hypothetical protein
LVVVLSGIAEIVLGIALIILPGYRVLVGLVVAAFFVAIFLGNISQYVNRIDAYRYGAGGTVAVSTAASIMGFVEYGGVGGMA